LQSKWLVRPCPLTAAIVCLQTMIAGPPSLRWPATRARAWKLTLVCIAECPEFGVIMCLGKASRVVWHAVCAVVLVGAVALFFGNVNQVLVRLWARVARNPSADGSSAPLSGRLV
jgi:hypothetical protein